MCTLLIGVDVLGAGTLVLGANRDESPGRPTDGPGVLRERPRVVGGRDRVAGGTWLAVREGRLVAALMNRRPEPGDETSPAALRSRGLLCLEAAASGPAYGGAARIDPGTGEPRPERLDFLLRLFSRERYARCTLVVLTIGEGAWAIHGGGGDEPPSVAPIGQGWHAITHRELDDSHEPRTRFARERLLDARPASSDEAMDVVAGILRHHGDDRTPPVCLHRDGFPTVSSSLIVLGAPGGPRYRHAAGPPCVTPYEDCSALVAP
ncbi:MAG TPA: NRDE family protein [Candidatus Eisenbacteria bacterium]|nr:NRDE family protein [Candidatus Eisenbacteria bacterium]